MSGTPFAHPLPRSRLRKSRSTVPGFALLFFGWPVVTGMQPPWWALVGALFYRGLSAWAIALQLRARKPTP